MKIVVVNTAASEGGALSVLRDFYSYVRDNDRENEWVFLVSDNYIEETANIRILVKPELKSKLKRLAFDFYQGKKLIKELKADVVFNMQNTAIYGLDVPQVLYLHQSLPFQDVKSFSFFKGNEIKYALIQHGLGYLIKRGLSVVDKIIVQTNWMKEAVGKLNKAYIDKLRVIPPNVSVPKQEVEVNGTNFFYPTSDTLYKNIDLIDKACLLINEEYPELGFNVEITIDRNLKSKSVNSIGSISRDEVFEKLSKSVLVFPSYIETFGLPLAEARLVGTIILAADTPFAREILDGYPNAYFYKYDDAEKLKTLMLRVINGGISLQNVAASKETEDINSWQQVYNTIVR